MTRAGKDVANRMTGGAGKDSCGGSSVAGGQKATGKRVDARASARARVAAAEAEAEGAGGERGSRAERQPLLPAEGAQQVMQMQIAAQQQIAAQVPQPPALVRLPSHMCQFALAKPPGRGAPDLGEGGYGRVYAGVDVREL